MIRHSLIYVYIIFSSVASATWFDDIPRTLTQPDGNIIHCFITGDQYVRRLHDQNDYTIILNQQDGYYYYAELSGHQLIPTTYKVGSCGWRSDTWDISRRGCIPASAVILCAGRIFQTWTRRSHIRRDCSGQYIHTLCG